MQSALVILAIGLLSACTSVPEAANTCADPRPQVCTMEYAPTCAVLGSGDRKEYASPCSACSDPEVTSYDTGSCPQ